jgi:hypothetical protein
MGLILEKEKKNSGQKSRPTVPLTYLCRTNEDKHFWVPEYTAAGFCTTLMMKVMLISVTSFGKLSVFR